MNGFGIVKLPNVGVCSVHGEKVSSISRHCTPFNSIHDPHPKEYFAQIHFLIINGYDLHNFDKTIFHSASKTIIPSGHQSDFDDMKFFFVNIL